MSNNNFEKPTFPKPKRKRNDKPVFSARVPKAVKNDFTKWAQDKDLALGEATEFALKLAMHSNP